MFLGVVNFYHRFISKLAQALALLQEACNGKGRAIRWTKSCQDALAAASLLQHPARDEPRAIPADASDVAVGGSLNQFHGCH